MKIETVKEMGLGFFKALKISAVCILSLAFVCVSCDKDEDDETTLLYLDGTPNFYLPIYALSGDTLKLEASGVYTEGAYYAWSYAGLDSLYEAEDLTSIWVIAPDSLGVYEVTLTADCGDEYYSSSLTQFISVIGDSTLTGMVPSSNVFVDPRDNNEYGVVEIGNLEWFNRDLNWNGAGQGYGSTEAAAKVLGRLYTWNDATGGETSSGLGNGVQGVCPPGWSIPTNEDWIDLAMALNGGNQVEFLENWKGIAPDLMADAYFNGSAAWVYSPDVTPVNTYGWNALGTGCAQNNYQNYSNMLKYGFWWSSTEMDSNNAHYRYIYNEYPDLSVNYCSKDGMGASVRCVRLKGNN